MLTVRNMRIQPPSARAWLLENRSLLINIIVWSSTMLWLASALPSGDAPGGDWYSVCTLPPGLL